MSEIKKEKKTVRKENPKLVLNVNNWAIIPDQNISIDKSLNVVKKKNIHFVLLVDKIINKQLELSVGIYVNDWGVAVRGKVINMWLPPTAIPQIAVTVKNLCFLDNATAEGVIESALALAIAPNCFLKYRPDKYDIEKKPELVLFYKNLKGDISFSEEVDITESVLSIEGYRNSLHQNLVIFEKNKKMDLRGQIDCNLSSFCF